MFLLVCVVLLIFPQEATIGAREGLEVAFETVVPAILPFAVFSSAVIYSGAAVKIGKVLSPLWRFLGLNPFGVVAFISGLLGGYPTGCKAVCDMYEQGIINRNSAEKMLSYVNNGGIVFAINILGNTAFNSSSAGVCAFLSAAVASLIAGCVFGREKGRSEYSVETKKTPLLGALGKAIASGGTVVMNIVASFVVFYALSEALKMEKVPLIDGLCEITKGIFYSGKADNLALATFFFTIGGLGVFAQSAALCAKHDLKLNCCIKGKLISAPIAYMMIKFWRSGKEIMLFSYIVLIAVCAAFVLLRKIKQKQAPGCLLKIICLQENR